MEEKPKADFWSSKRITRSFWSPVSKIKKCAQGIQSTQKLVIQVEEEGQPESLDYCVFLLDASDRKFSPWHYIPLCFLIGFLACMLF